MDVDGVSVSEVKILKCRRYSMLSVVGSVRGLMQRGGDVRLFERPAIISGGVSGNGTRLCESQRAYVAPE